MASVGSGSEASYTGGSYETRVLLVTGWQTDKLYLLAVREGWPL